MSGDYANLWLKAAQEARALEAEVQRLTEGLREIERYSQERLDDGHPGLLDMHLVNDKARTLLSASATDGHADTCATLLGASTDPCSCGFVKPDGGGAK